MHSEFWCIKRWNTPKQHLFDIFNSFDK
ncbi:hypothetical protein E2C01_054154 [Portunus trituberculatus]|uniref:Uncharacterized protein n=1 Tax=Portunus trituberculatus TaxID=210409 RepID=A0A5B7GSF2_PORTR|nr:hypothetical protein [Portunus trituberculatus]